MVDPLMTNPEGAVTLGPTGTMYGAKMNIQWTGLDTIRANLKVIAEKFPQELGMALREECIAIMTESLRLCPFDQDNTHEDGTPHLNETGDVAGPYFDKGIYCILSYDTPYAVLQHEVQEYHHDDPEQWKYLEHPMNERAKFMAANLVRGVDMEKMLEGYSAPTIQTLNKELIERNAEKAFKRALERAKVKWDQIK